ncbi:Transcriptional regulator, TetR family [Candidatus Phaeomarinobacter ectocarpi]|uniref:Transcriptional regulator, TetR family n=1 Tax=Candidatus Phaeomarinibacter ectocarpi TaxID=1458461 RepID=X5MBB7_9HYPH|nr:TetR/AcrR family transcriptional regulator [Candidatus Phaeomarinobacter ectocarpi]CDO61413.1 Transcriptional regulator, TetR family [Candidatus Phaeomarinobacter ectocarpi]
MTDPERDTFHHGNLKAALLQAALDLLDSAGAEAITIRAVARKAGVSHAAPVNHFKDRKALHTAVCAALFEELGSEISERLAEKEGCAREGAAVFADTLITYGLRKPNRYTMLWRRDLTNAADASLQAAMDRIYDELMQVLESTKTTRAFDDHTAAIALWSLAHGYVSLRLSGNFEPMDDEVTGQPRQEAMLNVLLNALSS